VVDDEMREDYAPEPADDRMAGQNAHSMTPWHMQALLPEPAAVQSRM
jgi:hypothetical protein